MKRLLIVLLSCVLILSVAGCKRRVPPEQAGSNPASGQNAPKVLQLWMSGTTEEANTLQAMSREFFSTEQIVGQQFKVVNFPSEDLLYDTFLNQMAEGKGPDIIYGTGDWVAQNTSKLLPRLNDDTFQPGPYRQTFVRAAHELLIRNEQIYGIPLGVDTLAVFYNRDHTQDRLIDRNKPAPTWEGFQKDVERLTKTDNSIQRFSASGVSLGRVDNMFYGFEILENIMLQQNVPFFSDDMTKALFHNSTGRDPRSGRQVNLGVDSVNFYASFSDPRYKHYSWGAFLASSDNGTRNFDPFASGKLSMVFGYQRDHEVLEDLIESRDKQGKPAISEEAIGVAMFPQPDLATNRKVIGKVDALAVSKNSEFAEIAWRYLKFVSRKENLELFADAADIGPGRVDLIASAQEDPIDGLFAQQAKFARSNPSPISKQYLKDQFNDMVQKVNEQKGAARTLLDSIGREVDALIQSQMTINRQISGPATQQRPQ